MVATTIKNANVALIFQFLHRVVDVSGAETIKFLVYHLQDHNCIHKVFREYFKELEEESIRDNFVLLYELLDEVMDFGYPQTTESKILKE